MKIVIDGYCYYCYFGEVYLGLEQFFVQDMILFGFIVCVQVLGVEGVFVEFFMLLFGMFDLVGLWQVLDQVGLDWMWVWGYLKGLGSGLIFEVLQDLNCYVGYVVVVGVCVMWICVGGCGMCMLLWVEYKVLLVLLLECVIDYVVDLGVMLVIENYIDFFVLELVELVEMLGFEYIGVCFDIVNNLCIFDDLFEVIVSFVFYVCVVYLKDVMVFCGSLCNFGFWLSVVMGSGLIDMFFVLDCFDCVGFDGLLVIEFDYLYLCYFDEDVVFGESIVWLWQQLGC